MCQCGCQFHGSTCSNLHFFFLFLDRPDIIDAEIINTSLGAPSARPRHPLLHWTHMKRTASAVFPDGVIENARDAPAPSCCCSRTPIGLPVIVLPPRQLFYGRDQRTHPAGNRVHAWTWQTSTRGRHNKCTFTHITLHP
jgi:hypothetical protein